MSKKFEMDDEFGAETSNEQKSTNDSVIKLNLGDPARWSAALKRKIDNIGKLRPRFDEYLNSDQSASI